MDAVLLLQQFQRAARAELAGRDPETDVLLALWGETLAALAADPESLAGRVDWITKRWLLQQFCDQEKISWSDPWLKSQDLEYHQIDPARSLGLALARTPPPWQLSAQGRRAGHVPGRRPTPAPAVRSRVMRLLQNEPCSYYMDWEIVGVEGGHALHLLNPFDPDPKDAEKWMQLFTPTLRPLLPSLPPKPLEYPLSSAAETAFPPNYFRFFKSLFLGENAVGPSIYKGFFALQTPPFCPSFCTHGANDAFPTHAIMPP